MIERPVFDLQSHSTHSDGALPPRDVVAAAARAGVELLALSDHDTVDGVEEALEAARRHGIALTPAVEVSAIEAGHPDVHILGYGIDHTDGTLAERLRAFRADREGRAERMIAALRELGFELDTTVIDARADAGEPIGRPHIAAAVVAHPANAARLREEGLAGDASAFLGRYLVEDGPAFATRTTPTVPEAIAAIHDAGGVAVWAHPFWDVDTDREALDTLDRFRACGIDGVEAFYITHTREQTLLLCDAAAERDLLTTGSADFHGPEHARFHAFRAFDLSGREPRLGPIGSPSSRTSR